MELIKISNNKLKIMLTTEDMSRFNLDFTESDYSKEETRRAFRNILAEANTLGGFDITFDRVFIQIYTSRSGGCELFVTKAELSDKADSVRKEASLYCEDSQARDNDYYIISRLAWRFEKAAYLIEVCKRLVFNKANIISSEVWIDDNGQYHLLAAVNIKSYDELIYPDEYGEAENYEKTRMYISEHGELLCDNNAVILMSGL